jgi:ADP-ribose pyrophosphatase
MQHPDVQVISREQVADGFLKIYRYRMRQRRFDGSWSGEVRREICDRGGAVAVLLYDPDRDSVVMVEQFRVGAAYAGEPAWLMEIVAGMTEPGEDPQSVARRETQEEAGVEIGELIPVCDYFPSPGAFSEFVGIFCARVDSTKVPDHGGLAEEQEDLRLHVIPYARAVDLLDTNHLNNSAAIIAIGWLVRHRERLRRDWSGPADRSSSSGSDGDGSRRSGIEEKKGTAS